MRRILIVGGAAAGKSELARALGRRTGLPVRHLTQILWLPGWVARARSDADRMIRDIEAEDLWIVEGEDARGERELAGRADLLLWLDTPMPLRIWRLFAMLRAGGVLPGQPAGCPASLSGTLTRALPDMIRRRQALRERHARLLMDHAAGRKVIRLGSPNEVRRLLELFPGPERWQQMLRDEEASERQSLHEAAGPAGASDPEAPKEATVVPLRSPRREDAEGGQ